MLNFSRTTESKSKIQNNYSIRHFGKQHERAKNIKTGSPTRTNQNRCPISHINILFVTNTGCKDSVSGSKVLIVPLLSINIECPETVLTSCRYMKIHFIMITNLSSTRILLIEPHEINYNNLCWMCRIQCGTLLNKNKTLIFTGVFTL